MEEVNNTAPEQPNEPSVVHEPVKTSGVKKSPKSPKKVLGALIVVVLVALLIGAVCWKGMAHKPVDENKNINTSEYQAVFLTNGQVYFGHLNDLNNKYVSMKDIYYLQVQQSQNLQQGTGTDASSQVSLAKLGSELHGPEDQMHIASDQVLFWENLKNDSKVTQAITKYQQTK